MQEWLQSVLLAPQFLWFLLLIPVVVLLYILKLRRTEVVISSTLLWLRSLQDLTANAPFQKLRKNLLLFLQILVLLLVVIALARPFLRAHRETGANIAVIVDHSASMQTREGDRTRLEIAREEALDMVDAMAGGDKMMVVAFAESADVLCELTDDKYRLRRALRAIAPSDTRTNIRDVMNVARSLAPDDPDAPAAVPNLDLVLFSDGNLSDRDEVGARALNMTYRKIGSSTNNAGIVGMSVRMPEEGQDEEQTFVLVHNANTEPLESTLSLYFEDSLIAVEEVNVPGGGDQEVVLAHGAFGRGMLRAELDHEDDLAADNRAWLALRPPAKIKVLLVTEGTSTSGYYLKRALALEPRVELSAIEPNGYAPTGDYDLVIFDGYSPDELPTGTLVFFDSLPPWPDIKETGTLERPPVLDVLREHPVMRFLNPGNVSIAKARQIELPPGARTLLSTRGGPLIADVSRGGQQVVVVAFDISDSNWPLRLSFPLFLQNLVLWTPGVALAEQTSLQAGKPIPILPVPDVEEATVATPSGRTVTVRLDPLRATYFADTTEAGVYTVTRGATAERVAVNLLDKNESDIAPADTIGFGRGVIEANTTMRVQTRELWRWFVYAALAVLLLEWWIYSRRAWI